MKKNFVRLFATTALFTFGMAILSYATVGGDCSECTISSDRAENVGHCLPKVNGKGDSCVAESGIPRCNGQNDNVPCD
jgi:hypothetical protein